MSDTIPTSHLMEKVDKVLLTEELCSEGGKTLLASRYPKHTEVGEYILTGQEDLRSILGETRAVRIANLFRRSEAADPLLSKLVHSSLDMDRLDYLIRDARAAGVPYGLVDLNYLLNNLQASPSGVIGVPEKAITAVDHFLLGRLFMYRTVYYHKTTFGLEETCRQLLRRCRNKGKYLVPPDGEAVRELVEGPKLGTFTDAFVDQIIEAASEDDDPVIRALANSIRRRRPPKLLREVQVLRQSGTTDHAGELLRKGCKYNLARLAERHNIPLGRFLVAETPPLTLEVRGALMAETDFQAVPERDREEVIKVFVDGRTEPVSVVDVKHSIVHLCSNHFFQAFRLYLVPDDDTDEKVVEQLRSEANAW